MTLQRYENGHECFTHKHVALLIKHCFKWYGGRVNITEINESITGINLVKRPANAPETFMHINIVSQNTISYCEIH